MHRISDFRAEKRFWCTEPQIFEQKKDFHAQKAAVWEGNKGWANHRIKKKESVSEFRYALFFLMVTSLDAPEGCRCTRDGIESSSAECGTDL